jgi:hypothetical protein
MDLIWADFTGGDADLKGFHLSNACGKVRGCKLHLEIPQIHLE